jgi:hypothetical protein
MMAADRGGLPSLRLLLRPLRLSLCGLFLRVLLGQVVAHDATTDGSSDRMVSRIVPGYAADHCPLQAACGVCGSGCRQAERGNRREHLDSVLLHVVTFLIGVYLICG